MAMGGEGNNTALLSSEHICREFSLAEILSATLNFHEDLVIGKGGFGKVYKGLINDGVKTIAAIKRLDVKSCSGQGSDEFWTEVKMLTRFRHCNLVSLFGFCSEKEMILVYEYMRKGTLHDHLHKDGAFLSWIQRLKICVGGARGLDYLHTGASSRHRIIHRDVKSANILLDDNLAARIADFGLSKVGPADQSHSNVNTNVKGTPGYIDPEYWYTGQLTRKSDVYSFGVVLFEVLCGKRAVHPNSDGEAQNLAKWAQECIAEGQLDEIIDSRVRGEIVPECLKQFAEIANKCLESSSKKRPTMAEVVFKLEVALSFQQAANSPADENVDSALVNIDSHKLDGDEVYGTGDVCQDEWIMGDESSSSYVKPVNKVKVFDSVSNKLNVEPAAEQEVMDDAGSGSYEDEPILNETNNVQSKGRKITFLMVVKKFFTTIFKKNPGHNDQMPLKSVHDMPQELGKLTMDELKCATMSRELIIFSMDELKCITRNFRSDMKLGSGRFGEVFLGWLDEDTYSPSLLDVGLMVAVKKVYQPFRMDKFIDHMQKQRILNILQEFRDPHFVKLIGYCLENEDLLLVSEFMQNRSIDNYLKTSAESLPWATRVKMALGVAQGLDFLYEMFGDNFDTKNVNFRNIMVDKDFNAKFSDFQVTEIVYGSLCKDEPVEAFYYHIKMLRPLFRYIIPEILFQILLQESANSREWKEKMDLLRSSKKFSVADPRLKQEGVLDGKSQLAKALIKYFPRRSDYYSLLYVPEGSEYFTAPKDIVRILKEELGKLSMDEPKCATNSVGFNLQ